MTNVRIVGRLLADPAASALAGAFPGRANLRPRDLILRKFLRLCWAASAAIPEVWCTPCGRSASGGDLRYFFPCWNRAFATIEEQSGEWLYLWPSSSTPARNVIHKVCLTPDSDLEAFRWWVGLNHAASPAAEISPYARSPSRVEGRPALCEEDVVLLSEQEFSALLRRTIQEEISIQIFVANEG